MAIRIHAWMKSMVAIKRRPLSPTGEGWRDSLHRRRRRRLRDVGSSHPGGAVPPKGWAVRPLKRYASWVQNVVRQFENELSFSHECSMECLLVESSATQAEINLAICWEPRGSCATAQAVTMRQVRTISRKGRDQGTRNPHRPYAGLALARRYGRIPAATQGASGN